MLPPVQLAGHPHRLLEVYLSEVYLGSFRGMPIRGVEQLRIGGGGLLGDVLGGILGGRR